MCSLLYFWAINLDMSWVTITIESSKSKPTLSRMVLSIRTGMSSLLRLFPNTTLTLWDRSSRILILVGLILKLWLCLKGVLLLNRGVDCVGANVPLLNQFFPPTPSALLYPPVVQAFLFWSLSVFLFYIFSSKCFANPTTEENCSILIVTAPAVSWICSPSPSTDPKFLSSLWRSC